MNDEFFDAVDWYESLPFWLKLKPCFYGTGVNENPSGSYAWILNFEADWNCYVSNFVSSTGCFLNLTSAWSKWLFFLNIWIGNPSNKFASFFEIYYLFETAPLFPFSSSEG